MKTIAHSPPSAWLLLPVLLLLTHCTPLQHQTTSKPTTTPPQEQAQPETPLVSPEEQLERFNRALDRA